MLSEKALSAIISQQSFQLTASMIFQIQFVEFDKVMDKIIKLPSHYNVRMAERSKAPDSRAKLFTYQWAFWSSNEGVGSNPTSDNNNFCLFWLCFDFEMGNKYSNETQCRKVLKTPPFLRNWKIWHFWHYIWQVQ